MILIPLDMATQEVIAAAEAYAQPDEPIGFLETGDAIVVTRGEASPDATCTLSFCEVRGTDQ